MLKSKNQKKNKKKEEKAQHLLGFFDLRKFKKQ
jgi:hypothetical protein